MQSYMSVDRIEGDIVVCEVELIPKTDSKANDFSKPCFMTTVNKMLFVYKGFKVEEGMIFVVNHNGESIDYICGIDENERTRRVKVLEQFENLRLSNKEK